MVEISHRERVVRAKIIYYGPAAGGKTTNLVVLHRRADPKRRGEMVSVNSTQDRTILLDLLPVKTPAFRGYDLRFQVIAVPGQRMYAASRKLLLNGADAVVFVANSASDRWEETIQSLREMNQNLLAHGLDPTTIPVTFQYNKRDLPDVTPLEAMDRTLNARRTASFPAVAIREEGVLETFSAALRLTMEDITERFKLGANVRNARSIEEWTSESMRAMFEWSPTPPEQREAAGASTPSPGAPSGGSAASTSSSRESPPTPAPQERVAVKVPVARSVEGASPSAATPADNPQAAGALVDSYAQAAADLTTALEDMRDQRDHVERRLTDLHAPFEATHALLRGQPFKEVLKTLVMRVAEGLGAVSGSLSIVEGGELRPVVLHGLQREPLFVPATNEGNQPLATTILESARPLVFVSGEPGPLAEVLEKSGGKLTSIVAIPIRADNQSLGLACFYLPPESAPPPADAVDHLTRLGAGIALVLGVASNRGSRDKAAGVERAGLVGRLAEQAVLEMGVPLDRLFANVGRLRSRPDLPDWVATELRAIGNELSRTKRYRDAVLGFMVGQAPSIELIPLAPVIQGVRSFAADQLERHAVRLEANEPAPTDRVRADAFLLRSAISAVVEEAELGLIGHTGGLVRISSQIENGRAFIRVADNLATLAKTPEQRTNGAWAADGEAGAWPWSFVDHVMEYFQGQWKSAATEQGNELTLILSAR